MQASIVISYYKNIPNLELILLALNNQTTKSKFEVIISEDDNTVETIDFIKMYRPTLSFPLIHVSQEDNGFRKCKILNKAIEASTSDFIIFIDGDCIPHREFVKEYIDNKHSDRILYGRRVVLSEQISASLLKNKNFKTLNFINLILTGCKRIEEGLYLKFVPQSFKRKNSGRLLGCNMGINKKDLIAINGFDEDYIAPGGGEDSDIEWRIEALKNISFYSMKFRAIVYHIYHPERFSKEQEMKNFEILNKKISLGFVACKNGIKKL